MKARYHSSVPFVITIVQQRGAWQSMLHQFMRARKHSSVPFVITTVQESGAWLSTLHWFMNAKKHSNVPFVFMNVQIRAIWLNMLQEFMEAKIHSSDYNCSQMGHLTQHISSVHEGNKAFIWFIWLQLFPKGDLDSSHAWTQLHSDLSILDALVKTVP